MPEEETSQSPASPQSSFVRNEDDFAPLYANNVQFERSAWDLKMLFGQLDQSPPHAGGPIIEQHTAMTVSWLQAKIMAYYLRANIALHEADYGKIQIPSSLYPAALEPLPDHLKDIQSAQETRAYVESLRLELIA